jgi:arylsulfatase A-like enzyme
VAWERTLGDLFAAAGYATMCMGKWHVGDGDGRWPTDHGFDEWYGPPHTYDECMWEEDPWYVPGRDPVSYMLEGRKGEPVRQAERLGMELRRNVDAEYRRRAFRFLEAQAAAQRPFFLYFNHSLMHMPVIPRAEYQGKSGNGDWADCLLELDGDFGELLDKLDALGLRDDTIVVFAGDNGPEEMLLHRGTAGYWEGSYFTGMEGSLRTPCIVRWPGRIPAGRQSNEIMHITDWFTTLLTVTGLPVPADRIIDGVDQSAFLFGQQENSKPGGLPVLGRTDPVRGEVAPLQTGAGAAEVPHRPGADPEQPAHHQPARGPQGAGAVQRAVPALLDGGALRAADCGVRGDHQARAADPRRRAARLRAGRMTAPSGDERGVTLRRSGDGPRSGRARRRR